MSTILTPNLQLQNILRGTQQTTWWSTSNLDRTLVDQAIAGVATWDLTSLTSLVLAVGSTPSPTSRVWIFTGTPPATVAIQFAPNTSQTFALVVNSTPRVLTFSQGSGSTFGVKPANTAVLLFDGKGAAANCTLFNFSFAVGPGSVGAPSYSFLGFPDVGMYVNGVHSLGLAANGVAMARLTATGTISGQPAGLNLWGQGHA